MNKKHIISLLFMFCAIKGPLDAWDENSDINKFENAILESFSSGDFYILYDRIREFLVKHPVGPVSVLYYSDLVRFSDMLGIKAVNHDLINIRDKISNERDPSLRNLCLLLINLELEKLLLMKDPHQAGNITEILSPIKKWRITGPYYKFGAGDILHPFLPEIVAYDPGIKEKSKIINLTNYNSQLKIEDYIYPSNGIVYAMTSFQTNVPVKIRIYSSYNYKVFINGKETLKNEAWDFQNQRIIKIWDTKKITLTIKTEISRPGDIRVIITDFNNSILSINSTTDDIYHDGFSHSEDFDYPHSFFSEKINFLKEKDSPRTISDYYRHMGIFFSELDSNKGAVYFKKSLSVKYSRMTDYLLASRLLEENINSRSPAGIMEGWRIINDLHIKEKDFIPARDKKFHEYIYKSDYDNAVKEGEKIISLSPNYFLTYIDYLNLLNRLGYESEFAVYLDKFRKKFPYSIYPMISEAEFYRERNPGDYYKICEKIISGKYIKKYVNDLIKFYKSREEFDKAVRLIDRYNHNQEFNARLADIYIQKKDFKKAREVLFKEIIQKEKPSLYFNLGLIDNLENSDPALYWEKMISLNPSLFYFRDYIMFLADRNLENPLQKYYNSVQPISEALDFFKEKEGNEKKEILEYPSAILFRGRIFELNKDRSSRVFCEDIIFLKDQKGIDKWGEYRVPYNGDIEPVRIRTYYKDNSYSDSYLIKKINDINYINLTSLRSGSIVQVSYIINNPVRTPRDSSFFSLPFDLLQNYDEPARKILIKIISPEDISLNIKLKEKWEIKRDNAGGNNIFTVEASGLKAIHQEKFTGSDFNCLPYFSFSTMTSYGDFVNWYKGLINGKDILNFADEIKFFKKDDVDDTIKNVYNYVSRNINLISNLLYYPENAGDTFYKKSGTVEDKVILAKSLFKEMGIKSYIAFAKKRFMPDYGNFISPEIFTNILLYVPLDISRKYWLDFSDPDFSSSTVDFNINNEDSLVILNNEYEIIKIEDRELNAKNGAFNLRIDASGNAKINFTSTFYGNTGGIRKYFNDKQYYEDIIINYYNRLLPNLDIITFNVENIDESNKPVKFLIEGESIGAAVTGYNKLIIQPILQKNNVYSYILNNKRDHPLFIQASLDEIESYKYILPSVYKNGSYEKVYSLTKKFGKIDVTMSKKKGDETLNILKNISFYKNKIDPHEYKEFLDFCMELKNIEFFNVVFRQK